MTHAAIVVSGTDTDVGKTIFAAGLAGALGAAYWKPVQAGVDPRGDRETVAALSGLAEDSLLPEAYRLSTPCSPHRAAKIDGITIDPARLELPHTDRPLGVAFVGKAQPESEAAIVRIGRVRRLGRLPWLDPLDAQTLAQAFASSFELDDFR